MPKTIGYHFVKSCYGLWLRGDERGHWSEAWDEEIGYVEPHKLHEGDPVRKRMAEERMTHPPVKLDASMTKAVADAIGECVQRSKGGLSIAAATIDVTHKHLLISYSGRDIDKTCKWLADQTTKALHARTAHHGPVWGKGRWRVYVFTEEHWNAAKAYIERHNVRKGWPAKPYDWIL